MLDWTWLLLFALPFFVGLSGVFFGGVAAIESGLIFLVSSLRR